MAITLGQNTASLASQRRLSEGSIAFQRTLMRVSSGLRINHASDDPAGLSISSSLNSDAKVYSQGIRNINDGISLLNIADGTVRECSNIVIRMRELAEQAANGVYSNRQRSALDKEFQALASEFNRLTDAVEFNGLNLYEGGITTYSIQAGYGTASQIGFQLGVGLSAIGSPDGTFEAEIGISSVSAVGPATGDFNNDGYDDIVSPDFSGGSIRVLLSNGNGTFAQSASMFGGTNPYEANTADFNGDGNLDFTYGDVAANRQIVFLGNGNGTFKAISSYAITGTAAAGNTTGDFNGDGIVDIAVISGGDQTINLLLGNGNGTFKTAAQYLPPSPFSMQGPNALDSNGDGNVDLLVADHNGKLYVMLGNGNGTLRAAVSYTIGTYGGRTATGDMNGDGAVDLVNTDYPAGSITVLLGNGNGSFKSPMAYAGDTNTDVELFDINADGVLDVITPSLDLGTILVYLGNGDGTLKTPSSYSAVASSGADTIASGDFNGDGAIDIAASYGSLGVLLGQTAASPHIFNLNIATQSKARSALTRLSSILTSVNKEVANIGSVESRSDFAISVLSNIRENYLSASSQILDADIAEETADLVHQRIVQQAAASVLAQANQQPSIALSLLGPQ